MTITPIAHFHSPFSEKFGIPRQSGLIEELAGQIVFEPEWRTADALRGIEDFDYLWLLWEFSANRRARKSPTVRPPLLGGNQRMGVFATRSPFRPNNLGLSCVRLDHVEWQSPQGPVIHVLGADLMDQTPIYDIKPYLPYADAHPDARGGFTDRQAWPRLNVIMSDQCAAMFTPEQLRALIRTLELDPRPHYQDDPDRIYGLMFDGHDLHFRVRGDQLEVV
jgi:tRNA-Thr(GGU) m(6)t(6)A37 methyltransferase TsaA